MPREFLIASCYKGFERNQSSCWALLKVGG